MTNVNYVTSKTITEEQIEDTNQYCGYERGTRFLCPQGFAFYYNQHRINNLDLCDADRYAFLNTIMGYDVGINAFREIDTYVWNYDNDLLEFTGNSYDMAMVEKISEVANLNLDDVDLKMKTEKLYEYIEQIKDERKKKILIMRYGLYDTKPYTQREIAKELGISRSYVSRIETKAIEELRELFEVEEKE